MFRKMIASAGALALLLVVANARPSQAQGVPMDKPVYFTFSQPVALPGKTLPAGKYLFKLLNSQTTRQVVQVFNDDGTQLQATFFTVPAERLDLPNDAEVRFIEGSEAGPVAIRTYWYPGERRGWEFIYPRTEALRLAKNAKGAVLTTTEDVSGDQMKDASLTRVDATGAQTTYDANGQPTAAAPTGTSLSGTRQDATTRPDATQTPTTTPVTRPDPTSTTQTPAQTTRPTVEPVTPATTPATTPAPRTDITPSTPAAPATREPVTQPNPTTRDELPRTASPLPMVVLAGIVALAAALMLRRPRVA